MWNKELIVREGVRSDAHEQAKNAILVERTAPGLHEYLMERLLTRYVKPGDKVCELGAGSGAAAMRIASLGAEVTACDALVPAAPPVPFIAIDLDRDEAVEKLGKNAWDLVIAIEVIEHLESPVGFLKQLAALMNVNGLAVITTPNMESIANRGKFALRGRLRMFDSSDDPTHISPIFRELLIERYLRRANLVLVEEMTYPEDGFVVGRRMFRNVLNVFGAWLGPLGLAGDNRILVLRKGQ